MSHDDSHDEWGPEEQARFASLPRERAPADSLEHQTIETLKSKGLIGEVPRISYWTWPRLAGALVCTVLLFLIGYISGQQQRTAPTIPPPAPAVSGLSQFALYLYGPPDTRMSVNEVMGTYVTWMDAVRQSGRNITGERLMDSGVRVRLSDGEPEITKLSMEEIEKGLLGYFLLEAGNYDDAVEIALDCPHVKFNGTVELRQLDW